MGEGVDDFGFQIQLNPSQKLLETSRGKANSNDIKN